MSDKAQVKRVARQRRHGRVRRKVAGTQARPRLAVYRSNRHIIAQVIDDTNGVTIASASTVEAGFTGATGNADAAAKIGKTVAERASAAGVSTVVFDRGGSRYHGRVAALADAARAAGLEF